MIWWYFYTKKPKVAPVQPHNTKRWKQDCKQQSCFYIVRSLMTFKLRQFALMHGIKTACCRGDTTFKNSAGKETIWNF